MQVNIKLLIGQSLGIFLIFALAIFLPAGNIEWLPGWIFLVLFFGWFCLVNLWLFKHNPGLLQERMSLARSDQKGWDKALFPLLLIASLGCGFNFIRWWPFPLVTCFTLASGSWAAAMLCSFALFFLTFKENSYLSTVARFQQERGHTVISTGPYHYVRHPMYAAMLVFFVATPLLLGSWYGTLAGLLYMVGVSRRAVLEEQMLSKELPGYAAYMTKVKYRLIPFVW